MAGAQLTKTNVLEPLHTHLVGLPIVLRDVLPVDGKTAYAERTV